MNYFINSVTIKSAFSSLFYLLMNRYAIIYKKMSVRGRGTLEIRKNNNPFFQSTSSDIGLSTANANLEWAVNSGPSFPTAKPYKVDGNFSFLYSRESDKIGGKVPKPEVSEVRMLSRSEFLKQRRDKALETVSFDATTDQLNEKPTAEDMLATYKHVSKDEDPRYLTSNVSYSLP